MHKIDKIVSLLRRYFIDSENLHDDKKELLDILDKHPELTTLAEELKDKQKFSEIIKDYNNSETNDSQKILNRILAQIQGKPKKQFSIKKLTIYAAACVLLISGVFFLFDTTNKMTVQNEKTLNTGDFKAGEKGAVLKLADGSTIELNGAKDGIVSKDGLEYEDGTKLIDEKTLEANRMLTLVIPNGKEFQITLHDGTKVWLNAGSELTYPSKFSEKERIVSLKGEAYFDVATNANKPFLVKTANQTIQVLGTEFNVNEYETNISTVTLVEGTVKVESPNNKSVLLQPNQQSTNKNGALVVKTVDVNEYIAWKHGEFVFNYESISSAMDKIKRWYDLDITVDPAVNNIQLWGSIKRKENFAEVLKLIKLTNENLKINIDGRKVYVTR